MILLLDIGNTRLKWACAEAGVLRQMGAVAHAGEPAKALAACHVDDPDEIWICSVMDAAADAMLLHACRLRWPCVPHLARSEARWQGLLNRYEAPLRLGADRWMAMIGAWFEAPGACVVADAGTALTVDVVDARGRHLGGLIAAGLDTSRRAVLGATRFATRPALAPGHAGLGRNTEACVDQGALLSCLGAIDRAARRVRRARCYLTGGDAPLLHPHLGARWQHRPHLVLEGLLRRAGAP